MHKIRIELIPLIFISVLVIGVTAISVQSRPAKNDIDLILLVDESSSMGNNDSYGFRYVAAQIIVDLLTQNDRVAVVRFRSEADVMKSTQSLTRLNSDNPIQIKQELSLIRSGQSPNPPPGQDGTNYSAALDRAAKLLASPSGNKVAVAFLTDGRPNDAGDQTPATVERIHAAMGAYIDQKVPVYLMLLGKDTIAPNVLNEFSRTGPTPIQLINATDIAKAFARVLTELKPGLYVNALSPIAESQGSDRVSFNASANPSLLINQAKFVFASSGTGRVDVVRRSEAGHPDQDDAEITNGYLVRSYSGSGDPISGAWDFSVRSDQHPVVAFALFESEITVIAPFANDGQTLLADQENLLAFRPEGPGADIEKLTLSAALHSTSCQEVLFPKTGISTATESPLTRAGVSDVSNQAIAWRGVTPAGDTKSVSVLVGVGDSPLKLRSCQEVGVRALGGGQSDIVVHQPIASTRLDGKQRMPLSVQIPDASRAVAVYAAIQSPGETPPYLVTLTTTDSSTYSGFSSPISIGGKYTVRFIAVGAEGTMLDRARRTVLLSTVEYVARDSYALSPDVAIVELRKLQQESTVVFTITNPLLTPSSRATFGQPRESFPGLSVAPCQNPMIDSGRIVCSVRINSTNPPPGRYEYHFPIRAGEQDLTATIVVLRPPAGIRALDPFRWQTLVPGGVISDNIRFEPAFLPADRFTIDDTSIVLELHDDRGRTIDSRGVVTLATIRQGQAESNSYVFLIQSTDRLLPGDYEAIALFGAKEDPSARMSLSIPFRKATRMLEIRIPTQTKIDWFWGIGFWLFGKQVHDLVFPSNASIDGVVASWIPTQSIIPEVPRIEQIILGNSEVPTTTLRAAWRDDGPDSLGNRKLALLLGLEDGANLDEGEWRVRIGFLGNATTSVQPSQTTVTLPVLGYRTLLPRLVVFVLVAGLVIRALLARWRRNRSKKITTSGTLSVSINGETKSIRVDKLRNDGQSRLIRNVEFGEDYYKIDISCDSSSSVSVTATCLLNPTKKHGPTIVVQKTKSADWVDYA